MTWREEEWRGLTPNELRIPARPSGVEIKGWYDCQDHHVKRPVRSSEERPKTQYGNCVNCGAPMQRFRFRVPYQVDGLTPPGMDTAGFEPQKVYFDEWSEWEVFWEDPNG